MRVFESAVLHPRWLAAVAVLAGVLPGAPFLGSVAARVAKAQSSGAESPRRLIVLFTHFGCLTNRWFPAKSHGQLTAADYEATTLKHLAPFASKLLMPRGIRARSSGSPGGDRGVGAGLGQVAGQAHRPGPLPSGARRAGAASWRGPATGSPGGLSSGTSARKVRR
ncbi:DUF1552 domain-containing protein [Sorangium sp. So ce375]|uniref:DUF1552 domain-containing protein n=1 Tax=Sorangium sp. So ce375 TaxID=3133306 RepID=UPI003F5C4300